MNDREQEIADLIFKVLATSEAATDRSRQKVIGISQIGTCREMTRRDLMELGGESPFRMDAWIGRSLGDALEVEVLNNIDLFYAGESGGWERQVKVECQLPGGRFVMRGTADLAHPDGVLWDGKTVDGFELIERDGVSDQQQYQRHMYALGLHQAGFFAVPIEQVEVANIWIDRSGSENRLVVAAQTFDWEKIYAAEAWLEDVVYATENGEEASKDKPRPWCAKVCRHFRECRQFDTDATGLITDPETISALQLYVEAGAAEKAAKKAKDEARAALQGVSGHTSTHTIRSIHIDASTVAFTRKEHDRLDIRAIKGDQ